MKDNVINKMGVVSNEKNSDRTISNSLKRDDAETFEYNKYNYFKKTDQNNQNDGLLNKVSSKDAEYANVEQLIQKRRQSSVEKYYCDEIDSITVILGTEFGVQFVFYYVPKRYYASEIGVLLSRDTSIRQSNFRISYKDEVLEPMSQVEHLADDKGIVKLSLEISNKEENCRKIRLGRREITFKSGLTIKVTVSKILNTEDECSRSSILQIYDSDEAGIPKSINVEINWLSPQHHKPFLGGYRNKLTDIKYHNASAQSIPKPIPPPPVTLYSRDTQTYKMRHMGQQTVNQMSSQFSKPGFYLSNYQDKLMTPGRYETADEYEARILRQIIIIQKYTRRWLAKRRMQELKKLRDAYLAYEAAHEKSLKDDKAKRLKQDFERRLHPKCRADFDRLFNALQEWKREKLLEIDAKSLTLAERKATLALLLDEETELIAAIGRHQLCASKKGHEREQINLLRKAAAPIRWFSSINSLPVELDTQKTVRARELLEVFESLKLTCLTKEERLDILLTVKKMVREYDYKICKELTELIEREAELIVRGLPDDKLMGLRSRINNRFVQFAKIPEVNPEIANYLRVPTGIKEKIAESLKGDIHYCRSCGQYLRNTAFPLSARALALTPCEACRRQDNRARNRLDLTPYNRILTELREKEIRLVQTARQDVLEATKRAELRRLETREPPRPESVIKVDGTDQNVLNTNPYPFLVNKEDIQYLIDEIWERRSVLSGWLDINDLVLTRWHLNVPWSPWNTILVTREEAEAHVKLGKFSLELAYADAMLNTVNQRLVMARNAFAMLYKNGIKMAYEQVMTAQRMQHREETQEWLSECRQRLPPLVPFRSLETDSENRHKAVYQPPEYMLPAIRGERLWSQIIASKEVTLDCADSSSLTKHEAQIATI